MNPQNSTDEYRENCEKLLMALRQESPAINPPPHSSSSIQSEKLMLKKGEGGFCRPLSLFPGER